MKHQRLIHRIIYLLTLLTFHLTLQTSAFADSPASICRRLPMIPAPQNVSTLRLLTAYAMPTIVAQFGTWASQTDYIDQATSDGQTLRNFARTAQPYQWEIGLFWDFSRLPAERTLTPLTEAYRHHEDRLHEAYKICRALNDRFYIDRRKPEISHIHNTTSLEQMLLTLEEQRVIALLQIYAPQAITSPSSKPSASSIATGAPR